jgi:hypothetical protein
MVQLDKRHLYDKSTERFVTSLNASCRVRKFFKHSNFSLVTRFCGANILVSKIRVRIYVVILANHKLCFS